MGVKSSQRDKNLASTEGRVVFTRSLTDCLKSLNHFENHPSLLDHIKVSKEECLLDYNSILRIVNKSCMQYFCCCRNENFSGSIWPRLWPAGSQGARNNEVPPLPPREEGLRR